MRQKTSTRKLTRNELRALIREELARGIPDYAFNNIAKHAAEAAASKFFDVLIAHINQTSKDTFIRNKRYSAAKFAQESLKDDKALLTSLEEKLKEKLLVFLDSAQN